MPDRLAEALRRILHARRLFRKTAVPGRAATQAAMIEPAHREEGDGEHQQNRQQEKQRAIACAFWRDWGQEKPAGFGCAHAERVADQRLRYMIQLQDDLHRE